MIHIPQLYITKMNNHQHSLYLKDEMKAHDITKGGVLNFHICIGTLFSP